MNLEWFLKRLGIDPAMKTPTRMGGPTPQKRNALRGKGYTRKDKDEPKKIRKMRAQSRRINRKK